MKKYSKGTPKIIILAGPNGAGKTTFAREFLLQEADCKEFINADLIAAGMSPFAPEKVAVHAGKVMITMINGKVDRRESFAFETTLSGLSYARHVKNWRSVGYRIELIFLLLDTADLAVSRVKARVAQGGHHISEEVIRRRFDSGLKNFHSIYRKLVDEWFLYDNSQETPRLLSTGENR